MAKHVDDLKLAGKRADIEEIIRQIQIVFGNLKIEWNNFTNCGVRHRQDQQTHEITLDQEEYIAGIKTISHNNLTGKSADDSCDPALQLLYMSVLGAIAFATTTRPDIIIFVSALQRHSHAPTVIHCKRLNTVVRWAQNTPKRISYKRLGTLNTHLRMYSDAAFTKEAEDGRSMRGAMFIRCPGNTEPSFSGKTTGHLIDYVGKSQKKVVRSTVTGELLGGVDTTNQGITLAQTIHEISTGKISAVSGMQLRESGGFAMPMVLYLDALSVYAALTATFQKIPADQSVLIHCLYLRQLLQDKVLGALGWCDTRDMHADGLTKGTVERDAIHDVMDGLVTKTHEHKLHVCSNKLSGSIIAED